MESAAQLNPRHRAGDRFAPLCNASRRGDHQGALSIGLRITLPAFLGRHQALAASCGQLGETDAARRSVAEPLRLTPDHAVTVRTSFGRWFDAELTEHAIDGLRKAGMEILSATAP